MSEMFVLANTKKRLLFLLIVAIFHRAVTEQLDPPIPCQFSENCTSLFNTLKGSSCKNGFCVCKYGEETKNCSSIDVIRHNNRSTGTLILRGCRIDQDCKLNNSFCNTTISQCDCKKDYILSNTKKMCLKKAESLDYPCTEDKQCLTFLPNMTCQNGQCNCISGYHYVQTGCYKMIDIEKPCNRTEECAHVYGAECTDSGICNCTAETVINEDQKRCLPVAREILENCVENVQCTTTFANSLCIDRSCQCRNRYHFESEINQCFIDKKVGENCGNRYECYQSENGNVTQKPLTCVENVCICVENYQKVDDRCVNQGTRFLLPILPTFFATIICIAFSR